MTKDFPLNPFVMLAGKVLVLIFSLYILFSILILNANWTVLDYANLLFHEGGHMVGLFFGQFIHILAGSLMQLLLPIVVMVNFIRTQQYFSAGFAVVWLGESMTNLSHYIADARTMQLPLLGGDPSIHDWNWILSETNLLEYDTLLGGGVRILGIICMITGILWMAYSTLTVFISEGKSAE